jgi:tRNA acetyltransferase TAN1
VCGVSVVGDDFDKLKKYNLAEIFEPTRRPAPAEKEG